MKISRFEEIEAWQEARKLMRKAYSMTKGRTWDEDRDLRRQMRRASVSIMANIAEGFDGGTDKEFHRFLQIARRSATELQSHLYVALDEAYISEKDFQAVYDHATTVKNLIGGFMRYLRGPFKPTRGNKS
jgi:four helix bundle protein